MQKIPDGQYLEVARTLWAITAISAPIIALISFRFFPAKKRWLWLIPLFAIVNPLIWFLVYWTFSPTVMMEILSVIFYNLFSLFLLFQYKKIPRLAQIARIFILSQTLLYSIFFFMDILGKL